MFELNSLAHRYYLEDLERAARHDIALQKHREKTVSVGAAIRDLIDVLARAFSPFARRNPAP